MLSNHIHILKGMTDGEGITNQERNLAEFIYDRELSS